MTKSKPLKANHGNYVSTMGLCKAAKFGLKLNEQSVHIVILTRQMGKIAIPIHVYVINQFKWPYLSLKFVNICTQIFGIHEAPLHLKEI